MMQLESSLSALQYHVAVPRKTMPFLVVRKLLVVLLFLVFLLMVFPLLMLLWLILAAAVAKMSLLLLPCYCYSSFFFFCIPVAAAAGAATYVGAVPAIPAAAVVATAGVPFFPDVHGIVNCKKRIFEDEVVAVASTVMARVSSDDDSNAVYDIDRK